MFEQATNKGLEARFKLLDKLILLFKEAAKKGDNELTHWKEKAKSEILIDGIGCSEKVADQYIKTALERI